MRRYLILLVVALVITALVYNYYPIAALTANVDADSLVVFKSRKKLFLYQNGSVVGEYMISLGSQPKGDKQHEGDGRTPEGSYIINDKNPHSQFYKNLGISYPNRDDIQLSKKIGRSPGGQIKIHGLKNGLGFIGRFHRFADWTNGCIAVTNQEMDEIYNHTSVGIKIYIYP